ncbi:MAG: hypothetical protein R2710_05685 [Acidimicrobiales bacterium]
MLTGAVDVAPPLVGRAFDRRVAGALIPVMLFTLGLQSRSAWPPVRPTRCHDRGEAGGRHSPRRPWPGWSRLDGDLLWAVAIQSAMPPAVFCMVLAMEHDLETGE